MRMHLPTAVLMGLVGLSLAATGLSFADLRFAPDHAYSSDHHRVSVSADLSSSGLGVLTTVGYRI